MGAKRSSLYDGVRADALPRRGSRPTNPGGRSAALLHGSAAVVIALLMTAGATRSQESYAARVSVDPRVVHLGEPAVYRGYVVVRPDVDVRWLPPEANDALTWGERHVRRAPRFYGGGAHPSTADTLSVEIVVQAFQPGRLDIPGLRVQIDDGSRTRVHRLPTTTLAVVPMIAVNDSSADFRAVHGPLPAPWWERVRWDWVILGAMGIAAIVAALMWSRRHKRKPGLTAAPAASRGPLVEALEALTALRALHLPEQGRFAEHSFRLGQLLRHYLEAVTLTTRPGDTSPELVRHVAQAGRNPEDLARLAAILGVWDRVKFARQPFTLDEAALGEQTTESFLHRAEMPVERRH